MNGAQEPGIMIDDVLKWIDANLPASLERLFALLRIDSISTDPAYAASCQKAADWLVEDLRGMGFSASSHASSPSPTGGNGSPRAVPATTRAR